MRRATLAVAIATAAALAGGCGAPQTLFEAGDHVVIIGNGLADRMQHDGWFEAYLQTTLPELQLTVRNHGFMGDRVDHRPRSEGFPSADEYLGLSQADVILAMFGYNESFDGDAGRVRRGGRPSGSPTLSSAAELASR